MGSSLKSSLLEVLLVTLGKKFPLYCSQGVNSMCGSCLWCGVDVWISKLYSMDHSSGSCNRGLVIRDLMVRF